MEGIGFRFVLHWGPLRSLRRRSNILSRSNMNIGSITGGLVDIGSITRCLVWNGRHIFWLLLVAGTGLLGHGYGMLDANLGANRVLPTILNGGLS